jgi:hypothetical protein
VRGSGPTATFCWISHSSADSRAPASHFCIETQLTGSTPPYLPGTTTCGEAHRLSEPRRFSRTSRLGLAAVIGLEGEDARVQLMQAMGDGRVGILRWTVQSTERGPELVEMSLMLATAFAPVIGYDEAARMAKGRFAVARRSGSSPVTAASARKSWTG